MSTAKEGSCKEEQEQASKDKGKGAPGIEPDAAFRQLYHCPDNLIYLTDMCFYSVPSAAATTLVATFAVFEQTSEMSCSAGIIKISSGVIDSKTKLVGDASSRVPPSHVGVPTWELTGSL